MKRFRDPQWALMLLFIGIISGLPLVQLLVEVRGDNGIRALDLFSGIPTAEHLRNFERRIESANWAAHLSRPWVQFAQFSWLGYGGEKALVGRDGWLFYKPGVNDLLSRPVMRPICGSNDPVAAITHFRDQLSAQGIHLLVMPVPNKESVYPDRVTAQATPSQGLLAPRTRKLLQDLRAAGVEVVDLFEEFERARCQTSAGGVPLYLAQDTHWSPAGVHLAATAAARRLRELGWISPGLVEYREQAAPVPRLGDIVRMLQVPRIEQRVPPEMVPCVQVVRRESGALYKDAAEAEVLALGDSFLRIYQQDAPTAAGFVAHLAKELRQPLMALVNDGGGSTLVRQELRARPVFLKKKRVVLWEFVERDLRLGVEGWKLVSLPAAASQAARTECGLESPDAVPRAGSQ